jgi:hypothetical protein
MTNIVMFLKPASRFYSDVYRLTFSMDTAEDVFSVPGVEECPD